MKLVGAELARRDRESFDWWYPLHLQRVMGLVDHLHVRVDDNPSDVVPFFESYGDRITWEPQFPTERWEEARERQMLLKWALDQKADYLVSFDSDEVLEPDAPEIIREFLGQRPPYRVFRFLLSYSSHHRPGYVLERTEAQNGFGVRAGRIVKLDGSLKKYRYQSDGDGMHCGTIPISQTQRSALLKEFFCIHYHATTCAEYMAERRFYEGTEEVEKWGGIDYLYRCDRFGSEKNAKPLDEVLGENRDGRMRKVFRRLERVPA